MGDTTQEFIEVSRLHRLIYSNRTVRNEPVKYTLIDNACNMYWSFQTLYYTAIALVCGI